MGKSSHNSKDTAKRRLKLALIYDKLEISEDILQSLNQDIMNIISKYFEIDAKAFKLDICRSEDLSALVINSPILSIKRIR